MQFGDVPGPDIFNGRRRFRRLRSDPEVFLLTLAVATRCRVSLTHLLGRSRGQGPAARARQLAMYLAHVLAGRPQDIVGDLFSRDRTTVAHACQKIEDRRECDALEDEIAQIECHWQRIRQLTGEMRDVA